MSHLSKLQLKGLLKVKSGCLQGNFPQYGKTLNIMKNCLKNKKNNFDVINYFLLIIILKKLN
jgi:hypothetical protein